MASRASKVFFGASVIFGVAAIYGVHKIQISERETMFAGVIRDEARLQAKRAEQRQREAEFEEQRRREDYLRKLARGEHAPDHKVDDWGCKTCQEGN